MKPRIEIRTATVGGATYYVHVTIHPARVPHESYDSPAAWSFTPRREVVGRIFNSAHEDVTDTLLYWTRRDIMAAVMESRERKEVAV